MTNLAENYGSIPDANTKENIHTLQRRLSTQLSTLKRLSILPRFSTLQKRRSQYPDLKETNYVSGIYKTLNIKISEQTGDTKQNSEEYPNNSSATVLGNAIITLFRALEESNKDTKDRTNIKFLLKISEPSEKQESLIDSTNRISISTTDLILAIFQPSRSFAFVRDSLK